MAETTTKDRVGHPECPRAEDHDRHTLTVGNGLQLTCEGRGPAKIKFKVIVTSTVAKEVDWEIDANEFDEWTVGREPTPGLLKEFIQSARDRDEVEDEMWLRGTPVEHPVTQFVEIEKVILDGQTP